MYRNNLQRVHPPISSRLRLLISNSFESTGDCQPVVNKQEDPRLLFTATLFPLHVRFSDYACRITSDQRALCRYAISLLVKHLKEEDIGHEKAKGGQHERE